MADTKITALTALTGADPSTDVLPIVDTSDTTMAASGTTKKISINNILGASGTATLASATITGAASAAGLTVTGATIPANGLYLPSANNLGFSYNSTLGMTLNSTGLGVGVTPSAKLDVAVTSADGIRVKNTLATSAYSNRFHISDNTGIAFVGYCPSYVGGTNFAVGANGQSIISDSAGPLAIGTNTAQSLFLGSNGVTRIILDSSGNVISNVPATAPTLGIDRQMVFNLTSNTNLRISVRGSDGVTRTTNLTLA